MKSELRSSVPPPSAQFVFLCGGASGKSAKRRRWRKKRAGFEEVPRLAAMTVDGNRLARRWARELRPYAGVESAMHIGGGVWSPRPTGDKRIFVKMSFRGAQRRGNPFSPYGEGAAHGVLRIATPACAPVHNDRIRGCSGQSAAGCGHPALREAGNAMGFGAGRCGYRPLQGYGTGVRRLTAAHAGAALQIFMFFFVGAGDSARPFSRCSSADGRGEGTPPYGCITRGAAQTGRRGNRRSAAGGGRSEPVSRKCPDWRPRQWTGIGWHDGGQSPPPTDAWQGNSVRGREYGLPRRCAPAMTAFWRCGGYRAGRAFALAFLAFTILFSAKNPPLRGQGRVFFYAGGVRYRALTVFSLPPLKQAPMISMTTNRPRYHATSHLWE